MRLSQADIEALTADPTKVDLPMPTLAELDYALTLLHGKYPVDTWYLRRQLKWLVKKMNKHYDIGWVTPAWGETPL